MKGRADDAAATPLEDRMRQMHEALNGDPALAPKPRRPKTGGRPPLVTPQDAERFLADVRSGKTRERIAQDWGLTVQQVLRFCERHHVPRPPHDPAASGQHRMTGRQMEMTQILARIVVGLDVEGAVLVRIEGA